jgi:hypothetical protein
MTAINKLCNISKSTLIHTAYWAFQQIRVYIFMCVAERDGAQRVTSPMPWVNNCIYAAVCYRTEA